jgi:hypothetical protein
MRKFVIRRARNLSVTLLALALLWLFVRSQEGKLVSTSYSTGYLLLAAIVFLALYNLRKKLPYLPLGSSTAWLQWHLYVALFSMGLFTLHAGTSWPNGILESTLAIIYLMTFASGIVGLYLTRTIPAQLARIGYEVVYERIPALRRSIGQKAGDVVLESVTNSGATTLADFYIARLYNYFQQPRGTWYLLRPTTAVRRALMREMQDVRRYLSDQEQAGCERLFALIRRKDDLDFHEARQGLLKLWLFVHIGLTCMLVIAAILHGILAHGFSGGAV